MIILVTNLKGGVGKTTTSLYLAREAAARQPNGTVILADADPQASAASWLKTMGVEGVKAAPIPSAYLIDEFFERVTDETVIVDTGPANAELVVPLMERADVVVIPTRVGLHEVSRVIATRNLIPAATPRGVVITQTTKRDVDRVETLKLWEKSGIEIFGETPHRVGSSGRVGQAFNKDLIKAYSNVLDNILKKVGK